MIVYSPGISDKSKEVIVYTSTVVCIILLCLYTWWYFSHFSTQTITDRHYCVGILICWQLKKILMMICLYLIWYSNVLIRICCVAHFYIDYMMICAPAVSIEVTVYMCTVDRDDYGVESKGLMHSHWHFNQSLLTQIISRIFSAVIQIPIMLTW